MIIHRSKFESGKKPTRLTQLSMERQRRYEAEEEQNSCSNSSKTGTAADSNAGAAFYEGSNGGSTQQRTTGSSDGVSQQSAFNLRQLTVLVQHFSLGSNTDQGAESIKQIYKHKGKHDCNKVKGEDSTEIQLHKGRCQTGNRNAVSKAGHNGEHTKLRIRYINTGQLTNHA